MHDRQAVVHGVAINEQEQRVIIRISLSALATIRQISASMKLLVLSVTCTLFLLTQVDCFRLMIQVDEESMSRYKKHFTKRQVDPVQQACDNRKEVRREDLTLPGGLNRLSDRVKFFNSSIATANLNEIQDMMQVFGISDNVRTVFNKLREGGCLPFFMGGSVRDQFLNRMINDIDIQIDCTFDTFLEICDREWERNRTCGRFEQIKNRELGYVGTPVMNKNIDLGSTSLTFYENISHLAYTTNSLAYDTNGNDVIIDLTGKGVNDTCQRIIRIPSDDDSMASWSTWLTNTGGSLIFRFWKLRTKNYVPLNDDTLQYITAQAKSMVTTNGQSFSDFYCLTVYNVEYSVASKTCSASPMACQSGSGKAELYNNAFSNDFGDFWMGQIVPNNLPQCPTSDPGPGPGSSSYEVTASYISVITALTLTLAIACILY